LIEAIPDGKGRALAQAGLESCDDGAIGGQSMSLVRATEIPIDRPLSWNRRERNPQHAMLELGSRLGMKIACGMTGLELISQAPICDHDRQVVATNSDPQLRFFAKLPETNQ
jgi:hypothetical protein